MRMRRGTCASAFCVKCTVKFCTMRRSTSGLQSSTQWEQAGVVSKLDGGDGKR